MIPLLLGLAWGQETIELPEAEDEVVPSALEDDSPVSLPEEDGGLSDVFQLWKEQERDTWSAGNFVRPSLALIVHDQVRPTALGVQAGRRWWQLKDGLAAAFMVQGTADFALAKGAGSYDLNLQVLGGPWLSVVGLQLGPGIGTSRWELGRNSLAPATGIDAVGLLVVDLKLVHLYGGAMPRFLVAGERGAAEVNPLGIGDELALQAGAGLTAGTIRIGFNWTRRFTEIDAIDRYSLNFRFRLL